MDEPTGHDTSTRRGLLQALARTAARHARERVDITGPAVERAHVEAVEPGTPPEPARDPARTPARAASLDELLALAHDEGLARRDDELRGLARRSLRMTASERDRADGWILTGEDWGVTGDEVLLAMVELTTAPGHGRPLPGEGWLALFVKSGDRSMGPQARRAHGVLLEMPAAISDAAEPVALHPELVIPRRWHEATQALDLDDAEAEAYGRLRARLQAFQGVESDDDGGQRIGYHRLLGYPNETTGKMPGDCVRAWQDWSVADGFESYPDPQSPWRAWQLLAQISIGARRRAYVWIHRTDLDVSEFGRLCAFVR